MGSAQWRRLKSAGVSLAFTDTGTERPVALLLHGLAGSALELQPTAQRLSRDFRVLALDQRGHGRSSRRPGDVSREAYVNDAIAVIERVAAGIPVQLIGQSMGAHTAMLVAARRPDLVDRLVMLEGGAGGDGNHASESIAGFLASWPVPFASREAATAFLGTGPLAAAWVDDLEPGPDGYRPRFEADVMAACLRELGQPRWAEWQSIAVPTLLVFGEQGMFSTGQRAEMITRRPGTHRIDLRAAGHDAHLDQFEAWVGALRGFLRARVGASGTG